MAITKHLTNDQVNRIMQVVATWRKSPIHSKPHAFSLFVELMLISGMRTDELCHVTVNCFDWSAGSINILRPAKGSDKGTVKLPRHLLEQIRAAIDHAELKPDALLCDLAFDGNSLVARKRMLQREWRRMGFEALGPGFTLGLHSLRHTGALAVYASSKDVVAVQKFLRHRSLVTTQIYLVGLITPDFGGIMSQFIGKVGVTL